MSPFKAFPSVGSEAPAFTLRDAAGNEHSTAAARGKWLVIYFYPKDDTPGCTIEACEFRDAESALQRAGALVWGVSPDDQASKAAFRDKFSLNFPILSDLDHQVAEAYGVWGEADDGEELHEHPPSHLPDQPCGAGGEGVGERDPDRACGRGPCGDQ